jgi:predicted RNase H-like HicB family nuclease
VSKREFYVVIEEGQDGFLVASVPELPGCHTQGVSKEELLENVREAIALCLEESDAVPSDTAPKLVTVEKVSVGL